MAIILRPGDRRLRELVPDMARPAAAGDVLRHQIVSDASPYVHLTEVSPGFVIHPHRHSEPEVTVILSGTARVGETLCEAGSVLVIAADEEYSLTAGPDEPLTFVVVRPARGAYLKSAPEASPAETATP